jgi:predicted TIM-barrel fold metal-dependent hydrolase
MHTSAHGTSEEAAPQGLPRIISVDDHVIEPAHLFERWLPRQMRDRGPRSMRGPLRQATYRSGANFEFVEDPSGRPTDWWEYEQKRHPYLRNIASAGFDRDDIQLVGITYDEMRPGCHDPQHRLQDMDIDGVEASLCFPSFPRFCGQTFLEARDKDVAAACVRAYNDWMVEEWCGDSGGRLIPLCLIPLWDVDLAVREVERNAARGVHAVCFSEIPSYLGLPSIHTDHWDRFFAACQSTGTVLCMHIGSSSTMPKASADAPPAVDVTLSFNMSIAALADWLFSGKLAQFPGLRLAFSEGQIGWIPYLLERADDAWEMHRGWGGVADRVPEPPSIYYHRSVFGCFFRDRHGVRSIDEIGIGNVTYETDYPHTDSTWPDTTSIVADLFADVDPQVAYAALRGNAIRMLHLDLA